MEDEFDWMRRYFDLRQVNFGIYRNNYGNVYKMETHLDTSQYRNWDRNNLIFELLTH